MSFQLSELTTRFNMEVKPKNARRCLFGRPDPDKIRKDLENQEKIMCEEEAERLREKWSFDVNSGPIEGGKFQYEVIPDSSVPSFYTKGYTSRKSKPVLRIRERSFFNDIARPVSAAKRKLDLDIHENNENEAVDARVPNRGDVVINDSQVQCFSPDDVPSVGESACARLCDFPAGLTVSSSTSSSSLQALSTMSRNTDMMTPPSKPRSLVQSSMKDYLAIKKQRLINTKTLPRT